MPKKTAAEWDDEVKKLKDKLAAANKEKQKAARREKAERERLAREQEAQLGVWFMNISKRACGTYCDSRFIEILRWAMVTHETTGSPPGGWKACFSDEELAELLSGIDRQYVNAPDLLPLLDELLALPVPVPSACDPFGQSDDNDDDATEVFSGV